MVEVMHLGDLQVDVVKKDIKNIHLSVYPPTGRVRIAAPLRMSTDVIRAFAIGKLGWIRQHQRKLQTQPREPQRVFLDRESHYVWGKRYMLRLVEVDEAPSVFVKHSKLVLMVRPGTSMERKEAMLDAWYRDQVRAALPELINRWERTLNVSVARTFVQRMKTKWGGCNPSKRTLRFNSELAKKPIECLEYIVVHEMMHLLEPTHNSRFLDLLDLHLPRWRHSRDTLNGMPVRAERWG